MNLIGVDIVEVQRIERLVQDWNSRFLNRIYSEEELIYCNGRSDRLAGRLAAKEAVLKALGSSSTGISWKEIQILNRPRSAPVISLSGKAKEKSIILAMDHLVVSISHTDDIAIAFVMGSTNENCYRPTDEDN